MQCRRGAHGPRGPWPPSRRYEVGWLVSPGPGRCIPRPGACRPYPVCRDAVHGVRHRQARSSARRWSGRLARAFGSGCLARRPAGSMRFTPREEPTPASAASSWGVCARRPAMQFAGPVILELQALFEGTSRTPATAAHTRRGGATRPGETQRHVFVSTDVPRSALTVHCADTRGGSDRRRGRGAASARRAGPPSSGTRSTRACTTGSASRWRLRGTHEHDGENALLRRREGRLLRNHRWLAAA